MPRRTHYLEEERILVVDDRRIPLTAREGQALQHLMLHAGDVVSRADLEREVWGMRPGVRSQTVPVTVRRLRLKLGDDELIETVWGVGWRFAHSEKIDAPPPERPSFTTPFHDRPELERLITYHSTSRVVTVVGPGGVGKTRLVGQMIDASALPHLWVQVLKGDTAERLFRRIATVGGLESSEEEALDAALQDGTTVVLDDAESAAETAAAVVRALPSPSFVITCRHPLELIDQAVLPVDGFTGETARAFLQHQLRSARWGRSYPPEVLDRVAVAVDGLPLALEFATAQPEPLDAWVEKVESSGVPGPEGERLTANVQRSLEPLTPKQHRLLAALSLTQAPVMENELRGWLGPDAVSMARDLGERSLLTWAGGWKVLATVATVVKTLELDWHTLREERDRWLLEWIGSPTAFATDPVGTAERLSPLVDELLDSLDRLDAESALEVVFSLCDLFAVRGPLSGIRDTIHRGIRAHPTHEMLAAMGTLGEARPDGSRFTRVETNRRFAARALWLHTSIEPKTVPLGRLRAAIRFTEEPSQKLHLERALLRARAAQGEQIEIEEFTDLERRTRAFPLIHGRIVGQLATVLDREQQAQRALTLLELELPTGIVALDVHLRATAAFIQCALDIRKGIEALTDAAIAARRNGQAHWGTDLGEVVAIYRHLLGDEVTHQLESTSGFRVPISSAILQQLRGEPVDMTDVPAPFAVALHAVWNREFVQGLAELEGLPNSRERRILSTILKTHLAIS